MASIIGRGHGQVVAGGPGQVVAGGPALVMIGEFARAVAGSAPSAAVRRWSWRGAWAAYTGPRTPGGAELAARIWVCDDAAQLGW
jgi:hypothetical protein